MNLREAFSLIWKIGLAVAVIIYAVRFNDLSETEMVQLSYLWLPIFVFGLAGLYGLKNLRNQGNPPKTISVVLFASIIAIVAVGLLMFFYEAIWPSL